MVFNHLLMGFDDILWRVYMTATLCIRVNKLVAKTRVCLCHCFNIVIIYWR